MKKIYNTTKEPVIIQVLEKNLFTKVEDAWVYTNDLGQVAMSVAYTIENDELTLDMWMLNDDLKAIADKIIDEINAA